MREHAAVWTVRHGEALAAICLAVDGSKPIQHQLLNAFHRVGRAACCAQGDEWHVTIQRFLARGKQLRRGPRIALRGNGEHLAQSWQKLVRIL